MSNQLQITGGAKVRSLEGVITGTSGVLSSVPLGAANGVATLDSGGKVPVSQLPSSVVTYLGTWNAATNTPTLVNGVGDAGDMYICNVAGTVNFGAGPVTFAVGDWVLYGSGTWQKSNGQNGTVTSVGASITGNAIGLTGSPITTAGTLAFAFAGTSGQYVNGAGNLTTFPTLITSIGLSMPSAFSVANSPLTANGSINVTGAGTSSQYIDGTGALQTFPALTGYVPYTGATTDVDLGTHVLNAQALHVKGTAGAGHLGLKHQTATPTGSANESLIFADVNGNLGWQNANLYLTTLVSNANTANRSYTFPNASGTLALTSDISYPVTSVFGRTGAVTAQSGDYTTTLVTEGTRLYYTDARARAALSFTAGSGAYNSTTGVITIPTNTSQLTNGANFITLASLSAGAGISYNSTTGVISSTITQYTDAMARAAISGGTGISYNSTTGVITNTITQYTDALARAAISLTTTGTSGAATYNSTTGVLNIPQYTDAYTGTVTSVAMTVPTGLSVSGSPITTSGTLAVTLTAGYSIPTTASQTNWDTAYTNRITSATSPLSITSNVISISQATTSTSGYLSSTDWNTFNSKQGTITLTTTGSSGAATFVGNTLNIPNYTLSGLGGIGGSGTANYLPKFTAGTTIGNSQIFDNGTGVGINQTTLFTKFSVADALAATSVGSNYNAGILNIQNTNTTNGNLSLIGFQDASAFINLAAFGAINEVHSSSPNNVRGSLAFYTKNSGTSYVTEKMRLDASGNLGLGLTPSAWNTVTAFQVGSTSLGGYSNTGYLNANAFYQTGWKYINTSYAARYEINSSDAGIHAWYTAPSGTAGSAISFTQAMTLTAAGYLSVSGNVATNNPPSYQGLSFGWNKSNGYGESLITYTNIGGGSMPRLDFGYWNGTTYSIQTTIFNSGNVLIGSSVTDSGYKLDVNGTGRFSDNITLSKSDSRIIGGDSVGRLILSNSSTSTYIALYGASHASVPNVMAFVTNSATALTIASTGAATFSSSVQATNIGVGYAPQSNIGAFIYRNAADYALAVQQDGTGVPFQVTSGGVVRMYVANAGNVGIGTTSPSARLVVSNSGALGYEIDPASTSGTVVSLFSYDRSAAAWRTTRYSSLDHRFETNGTTEAMRITSGGVVAIGTTTNLGGGNLEVQTNGVSAFTARSSSTTGANGGTTVVSVRSVDSSASYWANAQYNAWQQIFCVSGSTEAMRITSGGNVLIGTTTDDGTKLRVNGAIKTAGFGSTTARTWKLGELVTATVIGVNTTGYLTVEVNGSQYNLALANLA